MRFAAAWAGIDTGSGLRHYEVQVKAQGEVEWTPWLTETSQTSAPFRGQPGQSYLFWVRATDKVNNISDWVESGPVEIVGVTKYYHFGARRVAMRQGDVVYYLSGDHLGSVSLTTDSAGTVVAERRYLPYGQVRWQSDPPVTDFGFTGQRNEGFGLMDYKARYYDPFLGRFISADTIVSEPGSSGGFNRYRYARNNPLKYTDSSGHCVDPVTGTACAIVIGKIAVEAFALGVAVYASYQIGQQLDTPGTTEIAGDLVTDLGDVFEGVPLNGPDLPDQYTTPLGDYPAQTTYHPGVSLDVPPLPNLLPGPSVSEPRTWGLEFPDISLERPEVFGDGILRSSDIGRTGKQERLRELGEDPKIPSSDRGWIQQEINAIERGNRNSIRVPPGKVLAHLRGFEAKKGYDYEYSDLQDVDLHKLQHKYEGY